MSEFGELSAAERKLIDHCRLGTDAIVAERRPKRQSKANEVRAELIRFLVLGGDDRTPVHEYGVSLRGAWIIGTLAIEDTTIPYSLTLFDCDIERIKMWRSLVPAVMLSGSRLRSGLEAPGLRGAFGIGLDGVQSDGLIDLAGARLGGNLDLTGAKLKVQVKSQALNFNLAVVEGSVLLSGAECSGAVVFDGAVIKGDLDCDGSRFRARGNDALFFDAAQIGRNVFLRNDFRADGSVRLLGAKIGLRLECRNAHLEGLKGSEDVTVLECERLTVGDAVLVDSSFVGNVSFHNATIGGSLVCQGSRFEHPRKIALDCSSATISGRVELSGEFAAKGVVTLGGATIKGYLDCTYGRFANVRGLALILEDASISLSAHLSAGCHVSGSVVLQSVEIGRNLNCMGGLFESPSIAIDCANAEIGDNVNLSAGFVAKGPVSFRGASIGKDLNCRGGKFDGRKAVALQLEAVEIEDALIFSEAEILRGPVELRSARARGLCDDLASWSGSDGKLVLDGFTYDRFVESPVTSKEREVWLNYQLPEHLNGEFRPQPWDQVIVALRATGHPNEARRVAIAKNRQLRKAGKIVTGARTLHRAYGLFVGYGYEPFRLLIAVVMVWSICTGAYWRAAHPWPGVRPFLIPSKDSKDSIASFSAAAYSADVLLPIIDLNYGDRWLPLVDSPDQVTQTWGRRLRWLRWVEIILGWLFGGALAAMLTQVIKKD